MVDLSKIRKLCETKGVTMRQTATDLGMTEQSLHKIIKANSTKIDTLIAISLYFGVEPAYFFDSESTGSSDSIQVSKSELNGLMRKVLAYSVNGFGLVKLEWNEKEQKFNAYFDRLKKQYELTEEDLLLVEELTGDKLDLPEEATPKDVSKLLMNKDEFSFVSTYYYAIRKMEVQEELKHLNEFLIKHGVELNESIKIEIEELKMKIKYYENKSLIR